MIRLTGPESLFQIAVKRLNGLFPPERILVVTVEAQARLLREQCPQIPPANFLPEPMPRGTASVVGLAAVATARLHPQAVMAILTADHFIADEARFRDLLSTAYLVARKGQLVTLGIQPTSPSTGFGYIQFGESLGQYAGHEAFRAVRFREKPSSPLARKMVASGNHAWNSGMFVWQTRDILTEFKRQMPDLAAALAKIDQAWDTSERDQVIEAVWPTLRTQTIDYGIMEGAQHVAVIPAAGLGWSDVGSWSSLFEVLPQDKNGNITHLPQHFELDTHNSLIYAPEIDRLVVTIGVRDLIIVDTGDVLMICHKDQAQEVRQAVNLLKDSRPQFI